MIKIWEIGHHVPSPGRVSTCRAAISSLFCWDLMEKLSLALSYSDKVWSCCLSSLWSFSVTAARCSSSSCIASCFSFISLFTESLQTHRALFQNLRIRLSLLGTFTLYWNFHHHYKIKVNNLRLVLVLSSSFCSSSLSFSFLIIMLCLSANTISSSWSLARFSSNSASSLSSWVKYLAD